jgi:hypothetical protein
VRIGLFAFDDRTPDATDAAGKPKSLVRKCSELKSNDEYYSNYWRNDSLYEELTGDSGVDQCFEDLVWFSVSCRCVCCV